MRLLCLDLATNTGYACGSLAEGVIESGSYRLPKTEDDVGLYLAYFRKWLESSVRRLEPREIIFEMPVLPPLGKTTLITLRKLYGLCGLTELVAQDLSLSCAEANVSDVCSHFLGRGYPRASDPRKRATVAKCRERGWTPRDEDNADALALLDFALAKKRPSHALADPTFKAKVSERMKALHADPTFKAKVSAAITQSRLSWCPPQFVDLYREVVKKLGAREARCLIESEIEKGRRPPVALKPAPAPLQIHADDDGSLLIDYLRDEGVKITRLRGNSFSHHGKPITLSGLVTLANTIRSKQGLNLISLRKAA